MDEEDEEFRLRCLQTAKKALELMKASIEFSENHIILDDGTVMEIGEMPAEDLQGHIAESFETPMMKMDLDSIDISKEMKMLYGSRKEKTNEQMR